MQSIYDLPRQDLPESDFLFFFDSLIDTYKPTDELLWAYSVRNGVDIFYEYLNKPGYRHPDQALKAAKLHALTNFVERSRRIHCLTFYPTDRVFIQSEAAIAAFGLAENMKAINFYPNPQDRLDLLQTLKITGKYASSESEVVNLDGETFTGIGEIHLIPLDAYTSFLLEELRLFDVRDSANH